MVRFALFAALFVSGCAPPAEGHTLFELSADAPRPELPAEVLTPPPGIRLASSDPFITGEYAYFFLWGLDPNERAYLYGSRASGGPPVCPAAISPTCLDLVGNATRIATVRADSTGLAVVSVRVPNVSGGDVFLQGVTADGSEITTVLATTIYNQSEDRDNDGLTDGDELLVHQTDPDAFDTDGGGAGDGDELANGTDPLDGADDYAIGNCPDPGGSYVGSPAALHGFCWYIGVAHATCDSTCAAAGGTNLALQAESSFPDACSGPSQDDVTTWFANNGDPAGWGGPLSNTSGHSLGYGYPGLGYYGKCSAGTANVGAYPGDPQVVTTLDRQLVCPCYATTP